MIIKTYWNQTNMSPATPFPPICTKSKLLVYWKVVLDKREMMFVTMGELSMLMQHLVWLMLWIKYQVFLGAGETLAGKEQFKQWIWGLQRNITVTMESVFPITTMRNVLRNHNHKIFWSWSTSSKRNSQKSDTTMRCWARTMMVHAAIHCPSRANDICQWAFDVEHAMRLYIQLPNADAGLTLLQLFTKTTPDHQDLLMTHI